MSSACLQKFSTLLKANLICLFLVLPLGGWSAAADEDLAKVLKSFGPGVITQTSSSAEIEAISDFVSSDMGKRTFQVVEGDDLGQMLLFEVETKKGDQDTHFVRMGKGDIATIFYMKSNVYRSQQVDDESKSIAIFEPAEPVFLSKQASGSTVKFNISVKVSPVSSPTEVTHRGDLKCTYEVLGTFQVVSPAGTFDTICVRTRYNGKVGPADVDDSRYIFYAKKCGPVAIRTFSHVEAMIFYNKTKEKSLLLASYTRQPESKSGN